MIKLKADTTNGVYFVEDFDEGVGCEVLSQEDFYDSLEGLRDNEIIGAVVDEEIALKINREFPINTGIATVTRRLFAKDTNNTVDNLFYT